MGFNKICKDIKNLKIQGAEKVALAGLKALKIKNDQNAVDKLLSLRSTEPCLRNALNYARSDGTIQEAIDHFTRAHKKIVAYGMNKIKRNDVVFTHCHSGTVTNILKEARKKRNFEV